MSLGPQWCLGVLFGCFCLGKRLALGRGHLERTWAALRRGSAATGSGGGKASGDTTHPPLVGCVAPCKASVSAKLECFTRSSGRVFRSARSAETRRAQKRFLEGPHLTTANRTSRLSRIKRRKKRFPRQRFVQRTQRTLTPPPRRSDDTQRYS